MNLQGIGMVSALGRGVETLQAALESGPAAPSQVAVPFRETPFPVYAVSAETLKDREALKQARRADRFSKMATLAAVDAVRNAQATLTPERTGVVLATAFGPHPTVFSFLDEILEFGDAGVSPTLFSHSVHNAAASYISVALGLAGPSMTLTSFSDPFHQGLLLAQNWLDSNLCDSVLVGCTEECGTVLDYVVSQKLPIAEEGAMRPFFAPDGPAVIPGEGAVFFLLQRGGQGICSLLPAAGPQQDCELTLVDFESPVLPAGPAGCWSHLAGASPLSAAVSCAAGALMLQQGMVYFRTSLVDCTGRGACRRITCAGPRNRNLHLERSAK